MALSEEQKIEIKKIKKSFYTKVVLTSILYLFGMFIGDLALAAIDLLYVNQKDFVLFTAFGTGVIVSLGLQKRLEELHKEAYAKITKVLGS